jgi:hypothetical protein
VIATVQSGSATKKAGQALRTRRDLARAMRAEVTLLRAVPVIA